MTPDFAIERHARRIRLNYAGDGMTDIVVYPGPGWTHIFGFAVSDDGKYGNSPAVNDSLTDKQRALVLKNLDRYKSRDCRFRTVLVG